MALLFAAKVKHYNPEGAHNTLKTLKNNMVQNPIEDIVLAT
jgi:Na+/serine symporter